MEPKSTIIIIEDEKNICSFIETILEAHGYVTSTATNGNDGIALIASTKPSVVLLDLGLPDIDGLEVIRRVRLWSTVPIIVISARTQEKSKVAALDQGADDYLTKPFGTSELMARIRTALRHSQTGASAKSQPLYHVGDLMIDFERRLVKVKDQDVHLTQIEYKLVSLLAQNAGRVLTYDYITVSYTHLALRGGRSGTPIFRQKGHSRGGTVPLHGAEPQHEPGAHHQ